MVFLRLTFVFLILAMSSSCIPDENKADKKEGMCPAIAALDQLTIQFHKDLIQQDQIKIIVNDVEVYDECNETVDITKLREFSFYYSFSMIPQGYFDHTDNESKPTTSLVNVKIEESPACGQPFVQVVNGTTSIDWVEFTKGCDIGFNGTAELVL